MRQVEIPLFCDRAKNAPVSKNDELRDLALVLLEPSVNESRSLHQSQRSKTLTKAWENEIFRSARSSKKNHFRRNTDIK